MVPGKCLIAAGLLFSVGFAGALSGCGGGDGGASSVPTNIVYTITNDSRAGQNGIMAYRRSATGQLSALLGSPFLLNGKGYVSPAQYVNGDDNDNGIIFNQERGLIFATNGGSNSIAVMKVNSDGSLNHISGSPFASGGKMPISLTIVGTKLYCANKNEDTEQDYKSDVPKYTVFEIASTGALTQLPGATMSVPADAAPVTAYAARDGKTLFTVDQNGDALSPQFAPLRSFSAGSDGKLVLNGTGIFPPALPAGAPAGPVGIAEHPTQKLLYVTLLTQAKLATYRYDASGVLTLVDTAANSGYAVCWVRANQAGNRLYTSNAATNSVSVYDASDPEHPREIQTLKLKNSGANYPFPAPFSFFIPTATERGTYQLELSKDGSSLYVMTHMNPFSPTKTSSEIHNLTVGADGKVVETEDPTVIPVSNGMTSYGVLTL